MITLKEYNKMVWWKKILFLIHWLFFIEKPKKLTQNEERKYKLLFRFFFEGTRYMNDKPNIDIPVIKFGITQFKFDRYCNHLVMHIWLERPGVLIGKRGQVINTLTKYLSERGLKIPVKILIYDSKLWW